MGYTRFGKRVKVIIKIIAHSNSFEKSSGVKTTQDETANELTDSRLEYLGW